jgi:hypothetical protein
VPDPQVTLPTGAAGAPADQVAAGIDAWISAEPLTALIDHFGGDRPVGDLAHRLAALDDFSARHWDFRAGRERPEAREPELDPATRRLVARASTALGLVRPVAPARADYAHLVVLGGLAHACLRRVAHAAALVRTGPTVRGEVAVLGSFRPLSPAERHALAGAGVGDCTTEVDALDAAVRAAFRVDAPAAYVCSPRPPVTRRCAAPTPPTLSTSGPGAPTSPRVTRC